MSPGGTDASPLELVVGFCLAVSLITVITMVLRRRHGRDDLVGTQMREMEARTAREASPAPDAAIRPQDAATRIAAARAPTPGDAHADSTRSARTPAPGDSRPDAARPDAAHAHAHAGADADAESLRPDTSAEDAASPGPGSADATARNRQAPDATAMPDGWPLSPGGTNDAMADAFAWLRIAALVEAGQRDQAVELISATMSIPTDDAELLVDGLIDASGEQHPD